MPRGRRSSWMAARRSRLGRAPRCPGRRSKLLDRGDDRPVHRDGGGPDLIAVGADAPAGGRVDHHSTSPDRILSTIVGSPSGPGPALCLRTTSPGPRCGGAPPRSPRSRGSRNRGRRAALSGRSWRACHGWPSTRIPRPCGQPATRRCALANAVPNIASIPITSPVERISGPSTCRPRCHRPCGTD